MKVHIAAEKAGTSIAYSAALGLLICVILGSIWLGYRSYECDRVEARVGNKEAECSIFDDRWTAEMHPYDKRKVGDPREPMPLLSWYHNTYTGAYPVLAVLDISYLMQLSGMYFCPHHPWTVLNL